MLTDAASLLLALGALWMAGRPATTRHTWALARVEILAALVNGLFLWVVVVWLVWEAPSDSVIRARSSRGRWWESRPEVWW